MPDALNLVEQSSEARRNGDRAAARKLAEEAAAIAKACDDPHGLGAAWAMLARLHRDDHNREGAVALYQQAAELARKCGDRMALAHRLRHIGDVLTELDDLDRAEQCYAEAGPIFDEEGIGQLGQANFLRSVALLKEKQGAGATAADLWVRARALYAATGIDAGVQESDRRLAHLRTA